MPKDGFTEQELREVLNAEVRTVYDPLEKKTNDLSEAVAALKEKSEQSLDTTDIDGRIKDLSEDVKKASELADRLDKKLARPGGYGGEEQKTIGQLAVESDEFKALFEGRSTRAKMEFKAPLTSPSVTGQTLHPLTPHQRQPGIIAAPEQTLTIRDLIPDTGTISNMIEYPKETGFTNAAAPVAEGATKPESTIIFGLGTAPVRTIAHWIDVSKQALDDARQLRGHIDNRLTYGLRLVEEAQFLLGDGTGQNLHGIITQAAAYNNATVPGGAAATKVDQIRWAKLQARKAQYPVTAVVLNPTDWAEIELLKDAQDAYLFSAFTSGAEPRLWGMRVVESDSQTEGDFLCGAFSLGVEIFDREQSNVAVSEHDGSNFKQNLITIRAEERLAMAVYRPEAFVEGTFA